MVARTACFGQLSHSACHLNGCKGPHRDNTYNIDTNDFTIGLLDLLQLAENSFQMQNDWIGDILVLTGGSTRNETWRQLRWVRRCAYGRSWGRAQPRWASGGQRLDILREASIGSLLSDIRPSETESILDQASNDHNGVTEACLDVCYGVYAL